MKFALLSLVALLLGRRTVVAVNLGEGTAPTGNKTLITEAAVTSRYTIARAGSAAGKVTLGNATARPLGIYTDEAKANDPINVSLLGAMKGTQLVRAGAAITVDAALTCNASGKAIPATTGTYVIGTALQAAAADDLVEIIPAYPTKLTA